MKKKILVVLFGCFLTFYMISYRTTLNVNVENSNELHSNTLGTQSFVSIGDDLFYDEATRIVYIKNITYGFGSYVYTAYYAPNGFPYKYNPETNILEEINFGNE